MDQPATVIGVFAPLSRGSSSTIAPQSLPGDFGGTKQGDTVKPHQKVISRVFNSVVHT
jgi:hypothetical protein